MIRQNTSPPTREDPQTAGPRLFGTPSRRAPALVRRAGLGQARPPNLVPNCGVQGEPRTRRCDEHCYIRLVRRAACHDRRHLRHRESAFLGPFCHLRDFFSLCTQSPVSRCTSRSIAMREKLNLHLCSTYKADEMRPPWNFLLLWCHSRTQCSMFLGSISIHLPVHQCERRPRCVAVTLETSC